MKLLKMTATFGCLDGAVLELKDGLNLLTLPNESGKSTWMAFLTAMFYGIDTTQRAAKGRLPDKIRYQPWNGKAMEGTLELEHRGQILVLQRTSQRGKPMGAFRAWDKATGLEIPGLTADNCGRVLLGVEQAVFRRSACISGEDLAVTQDQELSRRLGSLASSGSRSDSYPQAEARLKLWANRLRYHHTGRIPETEDRLEQTRAMLEEAEALSRGRLETAAALARTEARMAELEARDREAAEAHRASLRDAVEQAHIEAETQASRAANLPPERELQRLLAQLEQCKTGEPEPEPPCPAALEGLGAEAVWPKAQADAAEYERLTAGRLLAMPIVFLIYAALWAAAGIATLCLRIWWAAAVCGGLAVLCLILWYVRRKRDRDVLADRRAAKALLASYGVKKKEELLTAAMVRRDWLLARERQQRQEWELSVLLEQIRDFAPSVETAEAGKSALEAALAQQARAEEARQALEMARLQRQAAQPPAANPEIAALRRRCGELEGELAALGRQAENLDREALNSRVQALESELADLRIRERAVALAREALASANASMAQVYAPRLTGAAGEYLSRLTGGRWDGLILDQDLTLSVREGSTGLIRPLAALSRGAQDQTWLALRLAMTRLLLPDDAPILLDDALLTFDPARERTALDLLRRENRQILLWRCR